MFDTLISLYAPHRCLLCETDGALLCGSCISELPVAPGRCYRCRSLSGGGRTCVTCRSHSKLYSVQAAMIYRGAAKELVGSLKFSGARAAAKTIASILEALELPGDYVVVPVPTATSRVRLRGYDQATLISKIFAQATRRRFNPALRRIGQHRQVGASRAQRLEQMAGSFMVWKPEQIAGQTVLLIDDVMTTGATLESAAAALKAAGAKRVAALVFARA